MDTSDEDLLDSHEDEIVVLNTLETSPATFSTQLIRKLGLKAKRTEAETTISNTTQLRH